MAEQGSRRFTPSELRKYDGLEGRPAYTAFNGKVYDVSKSNMWLQGRHSERHSAGEDLTERMYNAPHDESVLDRYPVVGVLTPERFRSRFVESLNKLHLHPMIVHFSEACPMLASLFVFIYLFISRLRIYETVSYYMIVLGFFSCIGCMLTGFFSWSVGYEAARTRTFISKIAYSALLFAIIVALFAWRTLEPGVLTGRSDLSWVYAALVFSMVPTVVLLGHLGGKIVFG